MKRVLMLNYEYPPLGGGTAVANYYLLKEFKKQNLKVDLLTSSSDKFKTEKFSKNINIIRVNIGKNNQNLHHQTLINLLSYFIKSTVWVLKHRQDYDLLHAFSGLPGGITAWLSGKPYIISFRGGEEPGYEPRFKFLFILIKPILSLIYSKARSLDANSQYLKTLVLKSFPNLNIKVIYNGVDTRNFYPSNPPSNNYQIICSSRFGARKGVEYLIQAMSEVLKSIPQAKLLLAGSGAGQGRIKSLITQLRLNRSVIIYGQVDHNKLASLYRKSQVFVLPSLSESFSNSLLEALACGLPVIATNVGGNPEIVNSVNGLLVPPADSQAISSAIIKLFSIPNPKIYLSLSWLKTAKEYFQLYQKII